MRRKIEKLASKNELMKYFTASNGKGKIAGWRLELNGILQVFNVCQMCSRFVFANDSPPRLNWL